MPGPLTSPYAPGADRMQSAFKIADLIAQQGRQAEMPQYGAHARAQRAYAVADLVGGISKTAMGVWNKIDEQKNAKAAQAELARMLLDPEGFDARAFAAKFGIKAAKEAVEFIDAERKAGHAVVEQRDPKKIHVDMDRNETIYTPPEEPPDPGSMRFGRIPDGKGGWIKGLYTNEELRRLHGIGEETEGERKENESKVAANIGIEKLEPLSYKLITSVGPGQRVKGIVDIGKAWLGMEDEVRSYQDARRAQATTLAARFQSGNMSEPDIDTWLYMVPDITRDTEGSAKWKWQYIKDVINGNRPPPGPEVRQMTPGDRPDLPAAPPPAFQPPPLPAVQGIPAWQSPPPEPGDVFPPPSGGGAPPPSFTPSPNASRQPAPFNPPNASRRGPAPGPVQASALPPPEIEDALRSKPPGVYVIKDYGRFRKMPNGSVFRVGE